MSLVVILALFITFSALLFYEEGIYWDPLEIMINFFVIIGCLVLTTVLGIINSLLGDEVNGY
ncbi:hypothetical protein ES703_73640 [subsurface metagenome]